LSMNRLRLLIVLLAAAFIIYGIYSGEATAVMRKASQICLECIGIG